MKLPDDFYFQSHNHFFFTCRSRLLFYYRKINGEIHVKLYNVTLDIYDFTIKNIEKIIENKLQYPTQYFHDKFYGILYTKTKISEIEILDIIDKLHKYIKYCYEKLLKNDINIKIQDKDIYKQCDNRLPKKIYNRDLKTYVDFSLQFLNDMSEIINKSGVYKLYDKNKSLIYVGKSFTLGKRIIESVTQRNAYFYDYCIINNKCDTEMYEIYYIGILKPILNKESNNEDMPSIQLPDIQFTEIRSVYNFQ